MFLPNIGRLKFHCRKCTRDIRFRCCKCFLGCYNIAVILLVNILPLYISGLDLAHPMTGATIGPQAPSTGMPSCEVLIVRLSSVKL